MPVAILEFLRSEVKKGGFAPKAKEFIDKISISRKAKSKKK
jgi:hypothetical protein